MCGIRAGKWRPTARSSGSMRSENLLFKQGFTFMLKLIALNLLVLGSMACYQTQVERIVIPAHHWLVATVDTYLPAGMR
jgi:hypothetical protein